MYDKNSRQSTIKELVKAGMVHSQEELQALLNERGYAATQATLSRDMKALGIVKMHDPQCGYSYRIPFHAEVHDAPVQHPSSLDGVLSIEFNSCLAVIKTRPGFANVVAAILDSAPMEALMGTVAGDDAVLLALREHFSREQVLMSLSSVLPGIENKLNR